MSVVVQGINFLALLAEGELSRINERLFKFFFLLSFK